MGRGRAEGWFKARAMGDMDTLPSHWCNSRNGVVSQLYNDVHLQHFQISRIQHGMA